MTTKRKYNEDKTFIAGRSAAADIRQWAKSKGIEVSVHGRLSKDLVAQFRDENPSYRPKTTTATIRAWAIKNGYDVSNRGQLAATIVDAYDQHMKNATIVNV